MHQTLRTLCIVLALLAAPKSMAMITGNPTALDVTLYKTELYNGESWVVLFENNAGIHVDLVGNPGNAFGSGEIAVGQYSRVRFTLKNQVGYRHGALNNTTSGGTDHCAASATLMNFNIDGNAANTGPMRLVFATDGGGGWTANGTDAYPFWMSQPVIVSPQAETSLKLAFKTTGMVRCEGTALSLNEPKFDVISIVQAPTNIFGGGDYWALEIGYSLDSVLRNENGATIPNASLPGSSESLYRHLLHSSQVTETLSVNGNNRTFGPYQDAANPGAIVTIGEFFRHQLRANSRPGVSWGAKLRLIPSIVTGEGTVAISRDNGYHRHQLDQRNSGDSDRGTVAAPTTDSSLRAAGFYAIDAERRITLIIDNMIIKGAFSHDYNLLTIADLSTADANSSIIVAIKTQPTGEPQPALDLPVALGAVTRYGWTSYSFEFDSPSNATVAAERVYHAAINGVLRLTGNGTNTDSLTVEFGNRASQEYPLSICSGGAQCQAPYRLVTTTTNNWQIENGGSAAQITPMPATSPGPSETGAGLLDLGGNVKWIAATPNKQLVAMVGNTLDFEQQGIDGDRHRLSMDFMTKQSPPGAHSTQSIAGKYLFTFNWDRVEDDGFLSVGNGYAETTFDGYGKMYFQVAQKSSDGGLRNESGSLDYLVATICIGFNQTAIDAMWIASHIDGDTGYPYTFVPGEPQTRVTPSTQTKTYTNANAVKVVRNNPQNRLPLGDALCATGEKMDAMLAWDNQETPYTGNLSAIEIRLATFMSSDGSIMNLFDGDNLRANARTREIGLGIRLR